MSVLSQLSSIAIYRGISAPGHDNEVVNGIIAIAKHYIYKLMFNVQLPGCEL